MKFVRAVLFPTLPCCLASQSLPIPVHHHPLFFMFYIVCCHCRWQVMPTKSKSKLMEKKRNLWVGYNNFEVIMEHSWHFSPSVSSSDFRITSSPGRPAGYVVSNCQTHTGLSLKTLSLYFGKNCCLVSVDLWCYFFMLRIMWSRCVVQQCNCKSFFSHTSGSHSQADRRQLTLLFLKPIQPSIICNVGKIQ